MLTPDRCAALGIALNEATLLGVEIDEVQRGVGVTFSVLTLPVQGPAPADARVQFVFHPVGRVLASLRNGHWNDADAEIVPFEAGDMLEIVQSFGGVPVYGWEFFDVEKDEAWLEQPSLDWGHQDEGLRHHLTLFQEGNSRHLDLRIWFDRFAICDPYGNQLSIDEFCAGGTRWWKGFQEGDPRTEGFGLAPIGDDEPGDAD